MDLVRKAIADALGKYSLEFSEETVRVLEGKVIGANPKKPAMYAFVMARNWAIDQLRHRAAESRKKAKAFLANEKAKAEEDRVRRFKKEFDDLVFLLIGELTPGQQRQLDIIRLSCFEGQSDKDFVKAFPCTTREARYQWKCRGVKLLRKHASSELCKFIEERR